MRLHRRLRRLPRREPGERSGRCAAYLREGLPVRLARGAGGCATRLARTDLRQHLARLRPVQHAKRHPQPLLRAGSERRTGRELERRGFLERASVAARPGGARAAGDRTFDRKKRGAAPQLRGRADALRSAVAGRRCGAHRAADRRQGTEPGDGGRRLPFAGARDLLSRAERVGARSLFGPVPAPRLEGRALLVVVHLAHAPLPGYRRVRAEDPGGRARLPGAFEGSVDLAGRELRRAAARGLLIGRTLFPAHPRPAPERRPEA
ncbi:hypothetical protein VARIO8X_90430 [Burkholderiales bacterium 8X]|nr:hypothetical protein VARIO8X_90430 [Burkholderiales bacterium 8X]